MEKLDNRKNFLEIFIILKSNNFITRSPSLDNDIVCSLDQDISSENLDNICSKIIDNSNYFDKVFILFAWIGRPRANSSYDESWEKNKKIILKFI